MKGKRVNGDNDDKEHEGVPMVVLTLRALVIL